MKNNQSAYGSLTCILVCWFMLLPFDYWLIDPILKFVQWPFEQLYLTFDPTALFETDTEGTFWLSITAVALGYFVHFLITRFWKNPQITKNHFQRISSVILAFFLIKYGWDKIVLLQFYKPEPNILYTNLGWLSHDITFWSLIGSNPPLSRGIGLLELLSGMLLLFPRVQFLGALLSFGIFATITCINFCLDISVKQLSLALCIWSAGLIWSYPEKWKMLLGMRQEQNEPTPNKPVFKFHFVIYALLFLEGFSSTLRTGDFNFQNDPAVFQPKAFAILDHPRYAAVFVHSAGYLILEDHHGIKTDFKIQTFSPSDRSWLTTEFGTLNEKTGAIHFGQKTYQLRSLPITHLPFQQYTPHFFSDDFH